MADQPVIEILHKWELDGEMELTMAVVVSRNFDTLMETELGQIEGLARDDPHVALAHLAALISFVNAAAARQPGIIRRLEKWVQRLRAAVDALGRRLKASSFSVTVGWPAGISVGLSFPIT